MSQVVIDVPDDLFLVLHEQPEEFVQTARLATAIYYLRENRLSLGQAARLAQSPYTPLQSIRQCPLGGFCHSQLKP